MRLFVAAEVPEISVDGVRVGAADSPGHLTVLFLGEVDGARTPEIEERFAEAVRGYPAFPLELVGVGAFPNAERPRVLWIGVGSGAQELSHLHDLLVASCRAIALPVDDRPFVPHLTVRRIRTPRDAELARDWIARLATAPFARTVVSELLLKESHLDRGPVVHETRARFPLAGNAAHG